MLNNLSFARFQAYFQVADERPLELYAFAGATFRGALGHAMRAVGYGNSPNCAVCPCRSDCRYGSLSDYLFNAPSDHPLIVSEAAALELKVRDFPPPFTLIPPLCDQYRSGEIVTLGFTLIGKAIAFLPFFGCALDILGRRGVGRHRIRLKLFTITNMLSQGNENQAYDCHVMKPVNAVEVIDLPLIQKWVEASLTQWECKQKIRIEFTTPFRFKKKERLGAYLDFPIFFENVCRRLWFLSVHSPLAHPIDVTGLKKQAQGIQTLENDFKWGELERYSGRQKCRLKLGGLIGTMLCYGALKPFLPYLKMGEHLHIGKACASGFGRYHIYLQ